MDSMSPSLASTMLYISYIIYFKTLHYVMSFSLPLPPAPNTASNS